MNSIFCPEAVGRVDYMPCCRSAGLGVVMSDRGPTTSVCFAVSDVLLNGKSYLRVLVFIFIVKFLH